MRRAFTHKSQLMQQLKDVLFMLNKMINANSHIRMNEYTSSDLSRNYILHAGEFKIHHHVSISHSLEASIQSMHLSNYHLQSV